MKKILWLLFLLSLSANSQESMIVKKKMGSISMLPTFNKDTIVDVITVNNPISENYCRGCIVVYTTINSKGNVVLNTHRVIATSGDVVKYQFSIDGGEFLVNDLRLVTTKDGTFDYITSKGSVKANKYKERNGVYLYSIIDEMGSNLAKYARNFFPQPDAPMNFPMLLKGQCSVETTSFTCSIPNNYFFVIGDNRSQTLYGLVPIDNLAGQVLLEIKK